MLRAIPAAFGTHSKNRLSRSNRRGMLGLVDIDRAVISLLAEPHAGAKKEPRAKRGSFPSTLETQLRLHVEQDVVVGRDGPVIAGHELFHSVRPSKTAS